MKELRVDKKLRNKIIGTGYKKTVEWTQAKIKRIIFIDIFAAIPEVAALIALIAFLAYMGDGVTPHQLELTWLRDRKEPYNLGENEFHLVMAVDDMEAAHAKHEKMGCICFENKAMGIYFIHDPDNYWVEIIPGGK